MGISHQIDNWLDSRRDLEAGRTLLQSLADRYAVNAVTMAMVTRYSNSGTAELIANELIRIKESVDTAKRPEPKVRRVRFRDVKDEIKLTDPLAKLYEALKIWYKEKDALRWQSRTLPEGMELRDVNLKIIAFAKKIRRAYDRLDHFAAFGEDPGDDFHDLPKEDQVAKLTAWLRAVKSYPPYISNNKNSANPKIAAEVKRRQKTMAEIDKYLKDAD